MTLFFLVRKTRNNQDYPFMYTRPYLTDAAVNDTPWEVGTLRDLMGPPGGPEQMTLVCFKVGWSNGIEEVRLREPRLLLIIVAAKDDGAAA